MRLTDVRLLWLKLAATLASLIAGGCMSPIVTPEDHTDEIVVPDERPLADSPSISVTASPDAFAEIKGWLGNSNTITVKDQMTIDRDAVSVSVPAGATINYTFNDDAGVFQFSKPFPTVKASVLGFKVSPTLSQITLKPDGSGVARTGLGRYRFHWLTEEGDSGVAAVEEKLPEVWCYSATGCVPCEKAKKDFETAVKIMPFRPIWKDDPPPWMPATRPAFWWHTSKDQPSQDDVNNTRQRTGYRTLKEFIDVWGATREPKRFQRAGGHVAVPFAKPDSSSIGSRSVAHWSINGEFTPSRSVLIQHLSQDGIHRGRHPRSWLEALTTEQLRFVHDRDHGN